MINIMIKWINSNNVWFVIRVKWLYFNIKFGGVKKE